MPPSLRREEGGQFVEPKKALMLPNVAGCRTIVPSRTM
jgi:hypothetical protein